MSELTRSILACLEAVAAERARRAADAALAARVRQVKAYQHARFQQTYADLLAQPAMRDAARFFLDELYGPKDFTERDAQFARVVPTLVRLFSTEIAQTIEALGRLHALSERLDTEMAQKLKFLPLDAAGYAQAWRDVGQVPAREQQIGLMLQVGTALHRLVQQPLLRASLKLMRGPAAKAGLGQLQTFLETGFAAFKGLPDAQAFLRTIAERERAIASQLFESI